ncbi:hypothetical protein D9M69_713720 [compost metagenome]
MKKPAFPDISVFACNGSKCGKHKDFRKHLKNEIRNRVRADVEIFHIECTDRCKFAPVLCLQPQNIWFYDCDESSVEQIVREMKGR